MPSSDFLNDQFAYARGLSRTWRTFKNGEVWRSERNLDKLSLLVSPRNSCVREEFPMHRKRFFDCRPLNPLAVFDETKETAVFGVRTILETLKRAVLLF